MATINSLPSELLADIFSFVLAGEGVAGAVGVGVGVAAGEDKSDRKGKGKGGNHLGPLLLVCRHWSFVAASHFYRSLYARLVAASGGDGATLRDRLWETVKGEVRAYLRDVWAVDVGLIRREEMKESRELLWTESSSSLPLPGSSLEAHRVYRATIRSHFAAILPLPIPIPAQGQAQGQAAIRPSEFLALRDAFLTGLEAKDATSSPEAGSMAALLYRLAYIRLKALTKLAKGSMVYVDAEDSLRMVRQPSDPAEVVSVETPSRTPEGPTTTTTFLPTLFPYLPKVDSSAEPIALFSPHGTRLLFVCSKDVSPTSTLPFPNGKRPKKKRRPQWPNFGDELNKRCLVSCWVDGTDWREMDLTWEGSIHFSFTLTPPIPTTTSSTIQQPNPIEPYIVLTRDSSYGYLVITAYPLSTFPEGGVDLPSRMEGMRELHGGVGTAIPINSSKKNGPEGGGFWVSGHEYFPALADARAPLDALLSSQPPRERDRFAPAPGTPAFFRAMLREAMMPGSIIANSVGGIVDPFGNDQRILVKGGEVVVVGWVDGRGWYGEEGQGGGEEEDEEESEGEDGSEQESDDEWLETPHSAKEKGKQPASSVPKREPTPYHPHAYSTSLKQPNLFVSSLPNTAIVARLRKVPDEPVAPINAAQINAIWNAANPGQQVQQQQQQQQQGPAWTLDIILVDLLHSQRDRQRRRELESLVSDIRQQMHWEATHPKTLQKGKGKLPANVHTIGEHRAYVEQREVIDTPLLGRADEHVHGMKEVWAREPEDDPDMMRDNGNQTMLIAPTDPVDDPNKPGWVTLQAADTADEEKGYLEMLKEAAGDLYDEKRRSARVLVRLPLPGALLTWLREEVEDDEEGDERFHVEELGMPPAAPARPGAGQAGQQQQQQAQTGHGGAANVATINNLPATPAQQQQQRNNPAEMQHLLKNAIFYLDPYGSGLCGITRRGGVDTARTVWIVDLGRSYEGRRGSVWDPFGVWDFDASQTTESTEDEFARERNERLESVEQLWGTTVATHVFEKPVRSFSWINGGRFVVVTAERPEPARQTATAQQQANNAGAANVGGRTLNEDWEREATRGARTGKFKREDLLASWHLVQVTREEFERPPMAWEGAGPAAGAGGQQGRILPRTKLQLREIGSSRRLHLPQLVMPDGVMPLSDSGGVTHLDPANVSSGGDLFANVLSPSQTKLISAILEPESVPPPPRKSIMSTLGKGIWKMALSAADSYFGSKISHELAGAWDREDEQERMKSVVRLARVGGGRDKPWENIDLPGKFARFSPL